MLKVALSQLKTNYRRFIAISLAVLLAVAFLSATLMVNASSTASLKSSLGESYAGADLVVSPAGNDPLQAPAVAKIKSSPLVAESFAMQALLPVTSVADSNITALLTNLPDSPSLRTGSLTSGAWPSTAAEVTVDQGTADRFKLTVGSQVHFATLNESQAKVPATLSGITAVSNDPQSSGFAQFNGLSALVSKVAADSSGFHMIAIKLKDGVSVDSAISELAATLGQSADTVQTPDEKVNSEVANFTGGQDQLTIVLLAFAAIALLVSALVVANTFSVLVAQRTRELALLRCVGASKNQVRNSVVLEALIVGFAASVVGVAVAIGIMALVLGILSNNPDYSYATLAVPPSAIITGLIVGTLLTVISSLIPAQQATAVAPLAALRPAEDSTIHTVGGRIRLTIGVVLLLLGGVGLIVGGLSSNLILALPAGAASFVGLLMAATLFIPRLVAWVGKLAAPAGVPGKMAAANAVRNPRRTTATASALLIGVTLVTMMMTGAATARTTFDTSLNDHYPVDIAIQNYPEQNTSALFTDKQLDAARKITGVKYVTQLQVVGTLTTATTQVPVYGISDADAAAVLSNPANRPVGTSVVMPADNKESSGTLEANGKKSSVKLSNGTTRNYLSVASLSAFPALAASDPVSASQPGTTWISVEPGLDTAQLLNIQSELATALSVQDYQVGGSAIEKATFSQVIDLLLLVVTALLAIAVVIALIGVANTISLSVLERTRENSLLRALGLTRGQLRGMLAIEAVLIAVVAALFGSALGIVYGWMGAQSALGSFATVTATVPWLQILAVVAVAAIAGFLASVLPARRAAKLSPVEGLAIE